VSGIPAVLVVSGGGFQGLAVVRLLAESDAYRILVADSQSTGITVPFVDGFLRLPKVADRRGFDAALASACRDGAVRLAIPSTDHELTALADLRPALEASGTSVAVCDPPLLARLRDKKALYESLAAAGLPVLAPVALPDDGVAAGPLIGKLRHGWGGRGVVIVRSAADLEAVPPAERPARVWQPLLEGAEEISADFAIRRDAAVPAVGLRRRVRTSGGFAVVSDTVRDAGAEELVRRFAEWAAAHGGRGLFNVQLLRQGATLVVSDVNPRLGTSAVHWRDSGLLNPVLVLCAEAGLVEDAAAATPPCSPVRSLRYLEELTLPAEPLARVDGIVFDLDDTLVATKRWRRERLETALDGLALAGPERDRARREGRRLIEERPGDRLLDVLCEAVGWGPERRDALVEIYRATWPGTCPTYADVKPALDALRRRGFRLGLLTDNPPETQRLKLEASGLRPFFDAVVFSREAGGEKPDVRGFARVAADLGIEPGRLAMAGDNPHRDLAGAAEAGYARLFWLRRSAATCAFDPALTEGLPGAGRFEPVADLRRLAARLAG
jgi:FMN phosphatase YigB (HAD superfamily)